MDVLNTLDVLPSPHLTWTRCASQKSTMCPTHERSGALVGFVFRHHVGAGSPMLPPTSPTTLIEESVGRRRTTTSPQKTLQSTSLARLYVLSISPSQSIALRCSARSVSFSHDTRTVWFLQSRLLTTPMRALSSPSPWEARAATGEITLTMC